MIFYILDNETLFFYLTILSSPLALLDFPVRGNASSLSGLSTGQTTGCEPRWGKPGNCLRWVTVLSVLSDRINNSYIWVYVLASKAPNF